MNTHWTTSNVEIQLRIHCRRRGSDPYGLAATGFLQTVPKYRSNALSRLAARHGRGGARAMRSQENQQRIAATESVSLCTPMKS